MILRTLAAAVLRAVAAVASPPPVVRYHPPVFGGRAGAHEPDERIARFNAPTRPRPSAT